MFLTLPAGESGPGSGTMLPSPWLGTGAPAKIMEEETLGRDCLMMDNNILLIRFGITRQDTPKTSNSTALTSHLEVSDNQTHAPSTEQQWQWEKT